MLRSRIISMIFPLLFLVSCGGNNLPPGGSGLIEATEVIVSAETSGQLKARYFDEGDKINQGDTIGLIDTSTARMLLNQTVASLMAARTRLTSSQIGIEQAEFNFTLAKKEYDRVTELIKTGSVNQQQYDQVETAYKQAELVRKQSAATYQAAQADLDRISSTIDLLNKQFKDCFPIAPNSGTIVNKYIEAGELVAIGKPLVKIARLDTVWVKIYLPPADLSKIQLGGIAKIDPEDGQNSPLDGHIGWISDQAEFTPKNCTNQRSPRRPRLCRQGHYSQSKWTT